MENYTRAYRDPKSPLTPLTPLSSNTAFNFNFGGDNSLRNTINAVKQERLSPRPKRFSEDFCKLREVFERPRVKVTKCNQNATPKIRCHKAPAQKQTTIHKSTSFSLHNVRLEVPRFGRMGNKFAHQVQQYRKSSPIVPKPLSPRISGLLTKSQLSKYIKIFQKEEIDMTVFQMLSQKELEMLGINSVEDQENIMKLINLARKMF